MERLSSISSISIHHGLKLPWRATGKDVPHWCGENRREESLQDWETHCSVMVRDFILVITFPPVMIQVHCIMRKYHKRHLFVMLSSLKKALHSDSTCESSTLRLYMYTSSQTSSTCFSYGFIIPQLHAGVLFVFSGFIFRYCLVDYRLSLIQYVSLAKVYFRDSAGSRRNWTCRSNQTSLAKATLLSMSLRLQLEH